MNPHNRLYWTLDRDLVKQVLIEQELKRWWVAETAGIHRTTLRRWLSGRIVKVGENRLRSFAAVLNVPHESIAARCA